MFDDGRYFDVYVEYAKDDNGAGIGASHQTGWTGLVTWLLISAALLDPKQVLEKGFDAAAWTRLVMADPEG